MRDLIWARATAVRVLGRARQHWQGFLLRYGRVYAGKKGWTLPYRRWLTTVRFDDPAQQVVLQDYIHSVHDAEERIARLTKQIEDLIQVALAKVKLDTPSTATKICAARISTASRSMTTGTRAPA